MIQPLLKNILVFLVSLIILAGCIPDGHLDLKVINKSDINIKELKVTLKNEVKIFRDIKPESTIAITFKVKADSQYDIEAKFEGGKVLRRELSYISHGIYMKDQVIINKSEILHKSLKLKTMRY